MNFLKCKNKSLIIKSVTLFLVVSTAMSALASCNIAWRYSKYDRTGERYDYDLTEYISIPEYNGIEIPDISYEASETEVEDNKFKKLAYFADEYVVSDGVVEKYDLVVADYSCKIDGANYIGLDSSVNESYRNFMAGIGSFMIPEIDEAIVGMAPGETKDIKFNFPEPYYKDISVSGLEAEFSITLEKIRRQDFPEFDDEFVSYYYGAESADAYVSEIKEQLEHDVSSAIDGYETKLAWEYISSNAKLKKLPGKELAEMNDYETQYYIGLARKENMSLSEYATKKLGFDSINDLYDIISEYSQNAVRDEMIIYTIARCENITVSEDEINSALIEACSEYELTDIEACKNVVASEYGSVERFETTLLADKVYDHIADKAVKIVCGKYYERKAAGEYKVDPDAQSGLSKKEIVVIVVAAICVLLLILTAVLAVVAVNAKRRHNSAKKAQSELEEKRRLSREQKASKKKHYGNK